MPVRDIKCRIVLGFPSLQSYLLKRIEKGSMQSNCVTPVDACQGVNLKFLDDYQSRLSTFRQEGKMTNLRLICSGGHEINAQASVCAAMSGLIRSKLLDIPSPYRLNLTEDEIDVRLLIDFLDTGKLRPGTHLQTYFRLANHFEVPDMTAVCFGLFRQHVYAAGEEIIEGNSLIGLRTFFTETLAYVKDEDIHRFLFDYFAFRPLVFSTEECLRVIPIKVFQDLLSNFCFLMWDGNENVYFGSRYFEQCTNLVNQYCLANRIQPQVIQMPTSMKYITPVDRPLIAPFSSLKQPSDGFGHHSLGNYKFKKIAVELRTDTDFPANQWKMIGLTAYISNDWDGIQPLAGFDVTYEDIFTGSRKTTTWIKIRKAKSYTVKTVAVSPGDFIVSAKIFSGWLIDSISFVTRQGIQLGPFGNSEGGNMNEVNLLDFGEDKEHTVVGLHGFEYSNIKTKGQVVWNELKFCCAAIPHSAISSKFPFIDPDRIPVFLVDKQLIY